MKFKQIWVKDAQKHNLFKDQCNRIATYILTILALMNL